MRRIRMTLGLLCSGIASAGVLALLVLACAGAAAGAAGGEEEAA